MFKCIMLALLLILPLQVSSYTIVDSYFQQNIIKSEGWSVHNHDGRSLVDTCGKYSLFGYFDQQNALVRGIQLPPHNGAQLELVLWTFNKWAKEEVIEIWLDQKLLFSGGQPVSKGECDGEQFSTDPLKLEISNHQDESAILIIYAKLKPQNKLASWGISHFTFSVNQCTENLFCQNNSDQLWELLYQFWNSYDLKKFNVEGWGGSTVPIQCGVPFFGGKYSAIETKKRTFALKPNYKSKIKFLFARFSNGDRGLNDKAQPMILTIKINGQEQIQSQSLKLKYDLSEGYYQDLCLSSDFEYFYRYEINIDSANDKIDFEISSNQKNQGWGLRDFNLYIQSCSQGCIKCHGPLGSDCDTCNEKYFLKDNTGCVPKSLDSQLILFSQSFKEETFNEFDLWQVMKVDIAYFYNCSPFTLFGGYQQFDAIISASKYFKLPYANVYQIKFDLYAFGLWNNQKIQIEIGTTKVHEVIIKVDKSTDFISCGNQKLQGKIIPIETKLLNNDLKYHNEMSVTIRSTLENTSITKLPSWGFRNFELLYDPEYSCALLFTQINYKGDFVELCQSNIDFGLQQIPTQIKSILVPPQGKVTLYEKSEYDGKRYIFTQNTPIIEEELYLHLDSQNRQINDL